MMTGFWDRIEAKQRRTTRYPIRVGDERSLAEELAPIRERVAAAAEPSEQERLREEIKAVFERYTEWIDLQSLPQDEWDALTGNLEPDADGNVDLQPILHELLAASCVDVAGQDAERWSQQLKQPSWSAGDKRALAQRLAELNVWVPTGVPGKG